MSSYLSDPDYLFSLLTAVVKKYGGTITLTQKELKSVNKKDLIGMYYDAISGDLILKEVEKKDMLQAADIVRTKKEKVYEN